MSRVEILTLFKFKIVNVLFYYELKIKKKNPVENSGHNKKQVSSKSRGQFYCKL